MNTAPMNTDLLSQRASFRAMTEGTAEDWAIIAAHAGPYRAALRQRVVEHLMLLRDDHGGFAVDRYEHCLQTATRAHRAGKDDEYVVCALLHDIGDTLCPTNHPSVATAILAPYVSEKNLWIVDKHQIFQGYNYFHYLGADRNMRDQYAGHEHYDDTVEFCQEYDQTAFDPSYRSLPLEAFLPALDSVFATPKPRG